ncbi:hypothetical protein C1646_761527 [Rhizophagus diaphanus]|nr:hypothetical protein C1646_761527 [Rhizophagus diaphanus] [Rhizophagus sp. MUCL 43196]
MHMIDHELLYVIICNKWPYAKLEALLEYDSVEEFSDTDSLNGMSDNEYEIEDIAEGKEEKEEKKKEKDTMKLYVGKTFNN